MAGRLLAAQQAVSSMVADTVRASASSNTAVAGMNHPLMGCALVPHYLTNIRIAVLQGKTYNPLGLLRPTRVPTQWTARWESST